MSEENKMNPNPGYVAHNIADPTGTGMRGSVTGFDMIKTAHGHPWILVPMPTFHVWMSVEVYKHEGEPGYINMKCPMCLNSLLLRQDRKPFEYDKTKPLSPELQKELQADEYAALAERARHGISRFDYTLNIEPFSCTWELEPDLRRDFGLARCPWKVAIVNNVARPQ